MGGDPPTHALEITLSAEKVLLRRNRWWTFLRKAIDNLQEDPEPDGFSRFVAPANSGYSGCLQYEVYPWRIYYQLVNPARVIVIAIVPHPTQL